nr:type VI secretion system baseplate subunit TssF [Caballeronia sp. BR00000012568055]
MLDYYNQELVALHELGGEFARAHPGIGDRLHVRAGEAIDPYVERIVDSFSLLAARHRSKLDAEFPRFAARLLEVSYPNYTAPVPSIAVARFFPDMSDPRLVEGFRIPRGARLTGRIPHGLRTACEFRTGQDVVLFPIELSGATLTHVPHDLADLSRYVPANASVGGALRLRLRALGNARFDEMRNIDQLPFFLPSAAPLASQLFELLHTSAVALLVRKPGDAGSSGKVVCAGGPEAVAHDGFQADQSLLPLLWSQFHGYHLLQEYFACPGRFHSFALKGLASAFAQVQEKEVELIVLLKRSPGPLARLVDASRFALHCAPIVNLFRQRTDRVELSEAATEFHLTPRRGAPLDHEVYAVNTVHGHMRGGGPTQTFRPMYETLNRDAGNLGRYFSLRREPRAASDAVRRYGARTGYSGTEVFVSLVDQQAAPYREDLQFISADAWVTNRDLPLLVPRDGVDDLVGDEDAPLESIGLALPPSAPRMPFAGREAAWRLVRQINFNQLSLENVEHRQGGLALRDLLRLFADADDLVQQRQIQSLVGMQTRFASHAMRHNGPLVFAQGIECRLTVDEDGFSGVSPYLFGFVLEQFLMRHANINTFTRTELHSMQRGCLIRWPLRTGVRGAGQ